LPITPPGFSGGHGASTDGPCLPLFGMDVSGGLDIHILFSARLREAHWLED